MGIEIYNLGAQVSVNVRCPKCKSHNVVVEVCDGYVFVYKCESCSYLKEKSVCWFYEGCFILNKSLNNIVV